MGVHCKVNKMKVDTHAKNTKMSLRHGEHIPNIRIDRIN